MPSLDSLPGYTSPADGTGNEAHVVACEPEDSLPGWHVLTLKDADDHEFQMPFGALLRRSHAYAPCTLLTFISPKLA